MSTEVPSQRRGPYVVSSAMERDPASAASEYLAQFRNDIDGYVSAEALAAVTRSSPLIAPYDSRHRYSAFIDATGGGSDEYMNTTERKHGARIAGSRIEFNPSQSINVERTTLAELMSNSSLVQMFDSGALEILR